jgi:uncharacterized protein YjiS (DUF1127 family)
MINTFDLMFHYLNSYMRYCNTLKELNQLDDRDLADIGLSRSDIPFVAWQAWSRDLGPIGTY